MRILADDLKRPDAYPPPRPATVELRQTHVSWAFLTEAEVYKVKKPVSLGFLDQRTIEARRRACEAEVALNARLAAGVYLGVAPVRIDRGRACFYGDGEVVDWAVRMLRLPDAARADVRLANGRLGASDVDRIAEHLAAFHARCPTDARIGAHGALESIGGNILENFAATRDVVEEFVLPEQAREIERWQLDFVQRNAARFDARRDGGFVRDVHGDLRLEHVYLEDAPEEGDGITVLDCIEFADRFRCCDVACDLAFLSMDLAAHGRVDLAERLLAKYARATSDWGLYGVVDFYESYRAHVRAKVATLAARAAGADDGALRAMAEEAARRHYLLALACDRRALLPPVVVAIGGTIASGKSTVAEALADRLAAPIVDADRTRKSLLGVPATEPVRVSAFRAGYDPRVTDAVYDEMMRRAGIVLESGRPVILDASFRSRPLRDAARALARAYRVPFLFAECRAPERVCLARLEAREETRSVSDGRRAIFGEFSARSEPVTELRDGEHLVLDTTRSQDVVLAALAARVATWPRGLVA